MFSGFDIFFYVPWASAAVALGKLHHSTERCLPTAKTKFIEDTESTEPLLTFCEWSFVGTLQESNLFSP